MLRTFLLLTAFAMVATVFAATDPPVKPASDLHEGTVMGVTEDTVMLRDDRDNEVETFAVTPATQIIFNGQPGTLIDVQMGDRALIKGQVLGDRLVAQSITAFRPL
jgi:hypothetical protein